MDKERAKSNNYFVTLFFLIFLCGCNTINTFQERVYWSHFEGAKQKGKCIKYAANVASDLHRKNITAYYLEYHWKSRGNDGYHAIVLFEKNNKWFIVDNEHAFPYEVKLNLDILKMVKEFDPNACAIRKLD